MKRPGVCQNGGCPRLGTVEVVIPGLGKRHLCHHCHQALTGLFGDLHPVRDAKPQFIGGAA